MANTSKATEPNANGFDPDILNAVTRANYEKGRLRHGDQTERAETSEGEHGESYQTEHRESGATDDLDALWNVAEQKPRYMKGHVRDGIFRASTNNALQVSPAALLLLYHMVGYAHPYDDYGEYLCYATQERLANGIGYKDRRTLMKAIRELREKNLLTAHYQDESGSLPEWWPERVKHWKKQPLIYKLNVLRLVG